LQCLDSSKSFANPVQLQDRFLGEGFHTSVL
jgi:hypothetical protein